MSDTPVVKMERPRSRQAIIHISGSWTMEKSPPDPSQVISRLERVLPVENVTIDAKSLGRWDTLFVLFLFKIKRFCMEHGATLTFESVPKGAIHLLDLAAKKGGQKEPKRREDHGSTFWSIGTAATRIGSSIKDFHAFLGRIVISFLNILSGRGRFRFGDFLIYLQNAGAMALPIVSLVSFLVGLILAFVATVQLKMFGAQIFVADLVGIAMARDMGAMMVGILMAGRTGATYAAQIGTMQVNEEIDALRTLGIDPIEFLVIPRILALSFMMVPLCIYADLLGIAGGAAVGAGFSDVTFLQYLYETQKAVPLSHFFIGIGKCFIYGIIVSIVGCRKGLSCGRSAAAVGKVTTSAVVTAIVWIIVACAIVTVICYVYGV